MKCSWLTGFVLIVLGGFVGMVCGEGLPVGSAPGAIAFSHFPDRLHTFVWRNWEMVSLERMAEVVGTTPENISRMGRSMGLPAHVRPPAEYQERGYLSIIRRNWHILDYDQLLALLGWDAEKLAFALREDDFLWVKLGSLKPKCGPLRYTEPDEAAVKRCAEIRETVESYFGDELGKPGRARFDFLWDIEGAGAVPTPPAVKTDAEEPIRFLYSYFGVFGDPLSNPESDPYPDALLARLSEFGVNGVWMHVVLRQLAPNPDFADWAGDYETRIANLRKMVERAQRYGVRIYLYMNEPRAMPLSFFEANPGLRGVQQGDHCALCTSVPEVRKWMRDSLKYVFENVPGLGGVFTITGSENLTSCYSHGRTAQGCPRCSKRTGPEVIAEVNRTIAEGVWAGNPKAKVLAWDWGWPDGTSSGWGQPDWASEIIEKLPDDVYLMCVSEWGKPITRGGVSTEVGEYSISAVGPGPRAARHWGLAKKRGLKTIAKIQANCTWEMSAVPYLPVMNLVAEHCANLAKADTDGLMMSWTVGGCPSPNLRLVSEFQKRPAPSVDEALQRVARERYGEDAAGDIVAAWGQFSRAFTEYPFHGGYVYSGPTQYGPSNLLYPKATGYRSTMIGFPYDDVAGWCSVYPPDVLAGQFEKMVVQWRDGLARFEKALGRADSAEHRANVRTDLGIARAVALHFDSVANQVRFVLSRNAIAAGTLNAAERDAKVGLIRKVAAAEIENARQLFTLTREDPRIGFEASNHYYYLPLDLVEKVVNCRYVLDAWKE